MRHSFLDRYSRLSSPIHRIPVGLKLTFTLLILVGSVSVPLSDSSFFIVLAGLLAVIIGLSRIPLLFLVKRLLLLELFVIGIALLSLLQSDGLSVFFGLMARSSLCLLTIVLFSNTTRFSELLERLRRWRVPALIISILALMYRYVFLLVDEMERMQRARMSRTFSKYRLSAWGSLATVVAHLFLRSTERAERIYAAMCARGWK